MASAPRWKVYDRSNEYQASCKEVEAAAALVGNIYGDGSTIRDGYGKRSRPLWTEGGESQTAAESYDFVALTVYDRVSETGKKTS